jgi:hypothetical protein
MRMRTLVIPLSLYDASSDENSCGSIAGSAGEALLRVKKFAPRLQPLARPWTMSACDTFLTLDRD